MRRGLAILVASALTACAAPTSKAKKEQGAVFLTAGITTAIVGSVAFATTCSSSGRSDEGPPCDPAGGYAMGTLGLVAATVLTAVGVVTLAEASRSTVEPEGRTAPILEPSEPDPCRARCSNAGGNIDAACVQACLDAPQPGSAPR